MTRTDLLDWHCAFPNLDFSSNSSTCNYTLAQNNNYLVQETNHVNERLNKNELNSSAMKYRAERTLTFENVLIGDSTLKYLDPARFDIERKTYIKTMVDLIERTHRSRTIVF